MIGLTARLTSLNDGAGSVGRRCWITLQPHPVMRRLDNLHGRQYGHIAGRLPSASQPERRHIAYHGRPEIHGHALEMVPDLGLQCQPRVQEFVLGQRGYRWPELRLQDSQQGFPVAAAGIQCVDLDLAVVVLPGLCILARPKGERVAAVA